MSPITVINQSSWLKKHRSIKNKGIWTSSRVGQLLKPMFSELKKIRLRNKSLLLGSRELVLVFLDQKEARSINKEFRGKDYATDVLSFASDGNNFGELVLCPQVLARQAKEHGLSFEEEMTYMILHGVLHLLGYDHELSKQEERLMFSIQDRVFAKLTQ